MKKPAFEIQPKPLPDFTLLHPLPTKSLRFVSLLNTDLSRRDKSVFYHILSSTRIYTSNSYDERKKIMDRIRVMLADDNLNILRLLTDYLSRKPDIEVVAAVSDGVEIPDCVRQHGPDILVMDIIMPRRDGFMTLEALNGMEPSLRPKVIVLTGLARDDFIMRAIQLGASYYMVKPFDMNLLYERIVEIARDQPQPVAAAAPRGRRRPWTSRSPTCS